MSLRRRHVLAASLGFPLAHAPAPVMALQAPAGPVILSISGRAVTKRNRGDRCEFDMAMLERDRQRTIATTTPWYPESRRFSGPLMRELLAIAGVPPDFAGTARCIALNDYKVDIPLDDVRRFDVIVARLLDDKPMSVREKGPLFVMYPFDERPLLRTTAYFSRCIWQLRAIEVV